MEILSCLTPFIKSSWLSVPSEKGRSSFSTCCSLPYIILIASLLNRGGLRNSTCVGFCIQLLTAIMCLKCLLIPWYYKYLDSLLYDYIFACLLWYKLMRILKKSVMPRNWGKLKRSMGFCTFLGIFVCVECSMLCHLLYS